jgi:hypothetical protein
MGSLNQEPCKYAVRRLNLGRRIRAAARFSERSFSTVHPGLVLPMLWPMR